ncbi:MAG: TolC family protein [Candidatus Binataceae bacterium]
MRIRKLILAAGLAIAAVVPAARVRAEPALSVEQLVEIGLEANPQVKSARARWDSAKHSIRQNYAPADPTFGYLNVDSATNGFSDASLHTLAVTQALQFPGKAILQGDHAIRAADIARLTYAATIRDLRAQVETAYYQDLLDGSLADVTAENVDNLKRVRQVTQVAYSANQVTQTDFISAEFDLAAARQQGDQLRTAEQNDRTVLNQLLYRPPDEPLAIDRRLELRTLETPLDTLTQRAGEVRQEILETALTERNSAIALQLARLEYAPDYTLGYTFDNYLLSSFAPSPNGRMQDHGFSISFNAPIFFWFKQNEDVRRASYDLEAARDDLGSIKSQTAATVTGLYRTAQLAYRTASLYRDSLIPLARQDFAVALVAYSSGKVDFLTLAGALRRFYDARVAYLQAANQFLAGEVALEQAIGEPLPR